MPSTASWLEVLWTVAALIGCLVGAGYAAQITAALRALHADPTYRRNGPRGVHLRMVRRRAFLWAFLELGAVGIGALALVTPPPVRPELTLLTSAGTAYILILHGTLLYLIVAEEWTRRHVARLLLGAPPAVVTVALTRPPAAKRWYYSRTLWANSLLLLTTLLVQVQALPAIPPDWGPYILMATAVGNMALRLLTGAPLTGTPGATQINIQTGGTALGDHATTGPVVGGNVQEGSDG